MTAYDTAALVARRVAEMRHIATLCATDPTTTEDDAAQWHADADLLEALTAERDALRRFAFDQHRAIGALRRIHGGDRQFDDTGAEALWCFGESDEGWALIEPPQPQETE